MQDNSDSQYGTFRDNIPYLFLLLVIHPLIRRAIDTFFPSTSTNSRSPQSSKIKDDAITGYDSVTADLRLKRRVIFDYYFALVFIAALHGFSALKVLAILTINYNIATKLPRNRIPVATWVFNIGILFANELSNGYPYVNLARMLTWTSSASTTGQVNVLVSFGKWLDSCGGLIPRWDILFNLTVLRLISFNLDYYWSLDYRAASPVEVWHPLSSRIQTLGPSLTRKRRNNLTPPPCLSAIVCLSLPIEARSTSQTTSPTLSTLPSTLLVPSSLSTTTSHNNATHPPQ